MPFNPKAFAIVAGSTLLLFPLFSTLANASSNIANANTVTQSSAQDSAYRSTNIARKMDAATPEQMEQRLQKMAIELNLTPTQVDQIRTLRSTTRLKLDNVLSADQKAIIKTALAEKKGYKAAMQAANITEAQRNQKRQIQKDSQAAMDQILTPEQQAKRAAKMQEYKGKRQGGRPASGVSG